MSALPAGNVTFLFTDLERSTQQWEQFPEIMKQAMARHDTLMREAILSHQGYIVKTTGDGFFAAFDTARDAVEAALAAQHQLLAEEWDEIGALRVRMGIHTGFAEMRDNDYFGPVLNRTARIMATGHGGQVLLSMATQELAQDFLPTGATLLDMGEHRLKDLSRPERLFQVTAEGLPDEFPPLRTLDSRPNNLPVQSTPLVGREAEAEEAVSCLLRDTIRLLTFTGPGGMGKTRLSLQVGANVLDCFSDGVWFVPLAPLSDPALVPSAIAQALGVRESGGQSLLENLKNRLKEAQILLILDNFEQVVDAASLLMELFTVSPGLKMLVTSREVLRVYGEQEYRVPPLTLPDSRRLPPLDALAQFEAVRLFVDRAQAVKRDFALTPDNAPSVVEICRRLDGLPLAIELAAARIRLLTPQAMLPRLENRLKLLTGGARDLPARQQTLRGAIEWSYDLLEDAEKTLFASLSIFVDGASLEAIEAICFAVDLDIDLLEGLEELVCKSLLRQDETSEGDPRFSMLETIREYGCERLTEQGEAEALRKAHADYYLALAEEAEPSLTGGEGQARCLESLEREHGNLREAMEWYRKDPEGAAEELRLVGSLYRFWDIRGHFSEGRDRLEHALNREGNGESTPERAKACTGVGLLMHRQGNSVAAKALYEEALDLFRQLNDAGGVQSTLESLGDIAYALGDLEEAQKRFEEVAAMPRLPGKKKDAAGLAYRLGLVAHARGDLGKSRLHMKESLGLWRALGDQRNLAYTLSNLGIVNEALNHFTEARTYLEEALEICRALGDKRGIANALDILGRVVAHQNGYRESQSLLEEGLTIRQELGERMGIVSSYINLADVAAETGDFKSARTYQEEALSLSREMDNKWNIATTLFNLGEILIKEGKPSEARPLIEEGLALKQEIGYKPHIAEALIGLGEIALAEGNGEDARRHLEESLKIYEEVDERKGKSKALLHRATVALREGDSAAARSYLTESLLIRREMGSHLAVAECLRSFAALSALEHPLQAARLLAAAESIRMSLGALLSPIDQAERNRIQAVVKSSLGESAFDEGWTEGLNMTVEKAVATALEEASPSASQTLSMIIHG